MTNEEKQKIVDEINNELTPSPDYRAEDVIEVSKAPDKTFGCYLITRAQATLYGHHENGKWIQSVVRDGLFKEGPDRDDITHFIYYNREDGLDNDLHYMFSFVKNSDDRKVKINCIELVSKSELSRRKEYMSGHSDVKKFFVWQKSNNDENPTLSVENVSGLIVTTEELWNALNCAEPISQSQWETLKNTFDGYIMGEDVWYYYKCAAKEDTAFHDAEVVSTKINTENMDNNAPCTNPYKEENDASSKDIDEAVEKYMMYSKRTLAEMLAMRDRENDWISRFKKIVEDPNTFKVPTEPLQPVTPHPYVEDFSTYCFNAPSHRCVKGSGYYIGKCDGCPYSTPILYTTTNDKTAVSIKWPYESAKTTTTAFNCLCGQSKK